MIVLPSVRAVRAGRWVRVLCWTEHGGEALTAALVIAIVAIAVMFLAATYEVAVMDFFTSVANQLPS